MQAQPVDAMSPLVARRMLEALPEFTGTPEFTQLATAFKRVKNIARELPDAEFERVEREEPQLADLLREPAEVALAGELERRRPVIESLLADGANYRRALARGGGLRAGGGPVFHRRVRDGGRSGAAPCAPAPDEAAGTAHPLARRHFGNRFTDGVVSYGEGEDSNEEGSRYRRRS